jgi:AcrR family transcriptional regulator
MPLSSSTRPPQPKRRGRPRSTRAGEGPSVADALIDAATAQFAAYGFAAVGVRQIAAQASVDAAMIAHHFGSKLHLWQAVVDRLSQRLIAQLAILPDAGEGQAGKRLDQAIGLMIDLLCDTPDLAAFILREVVLESARSEDSYARLVKPIHDRLRPILLDHLAAQDGQADADYLFMALSGAIVVSVATRPLLDRMGTAAGDDDAFRARLKASLPIRMGDVPGLG